MPAMLELSEGEVRIAELLASLMRDKNVSNRHYQPTLPLSVENWATGTVEADSAGGYVRVRLWFPDWKLSEPLRKAVHIFDLEIIS